MYLEESKTVVIKIGSSLLINNNKIIREKWLSEFAKDVKHLQKLKKKYNYSKLRSNSFGMQKIKTS